MGPTDGLVRGMDAEATGAPISVPVGEHTLGRMFNVLGLINNARLYHFIVEIVTLSGALANTGKHGIAVMLGCNICN